MKKIVFFVLFVALIDRVYSQKIKYQIEYSTFKVEIVSKRFDKDSVDVFIVVKNKTFTPIYYIENGLNVVIIDPSSNHNYREKFVFDFGELRRYRLKKLTILKKIKFKSRVKCKKESEIYLSGNFIFFTPEIFKENDTISGVSVPIRSKYITFDSVFIAKKNKFVEDCSYGFY